MRQIRPAQGKAKPSSSLSEKYRRANALFRQGKARQARNLCQQVLKKAPDHVDALHLFGVITFHHNDFDRAEKLFARALKIAPENVPVLAARGGALFRLNRWEESIGCFDRVLEQDPTDSTVLNNRALALWRCGRLEEALSCFQRASACSPEWAEPHWNEAYIHLLAGDFRKGWEKYRWRTRLLSQPVANEGILHRAPLPADLRGRRLILIREFGVGDEIFYLRFARELRRRGAIVTFVSDPRIAPMLTRAGVVDRVVPFYDYVPSRDLHLAVADLPWMLVSESEDMTPPAYAIPASPEREAKFRSILQETGPGPYVGITWRAGTAENGMREIPQHRICDIVKRTGATPVIVQRNPDRSEVEAFNAAFDKPVLDLSAHNGDLEDMLALMGLLDEYICVDNTNQHLRAARGRTSHVLVSRLPDFRWMWAGNESPWFPGTHVYRQTSAGDWEPGFVALERKLAANIF